MKSMVFNLFIFTFYSFSTPSILFKMATRERQEKFFKVLNEYYSKISKKITYKFLISIDEDDKQMNQDSVKKHLSKYTNLEFRIGKSNSKIHACNRDIQDFYQNYDIIVLLSDDMFPIVQNFDLIIAAKMKEAFPAYDGVINFNDGQVGDRLCSLPILGSKFYKSFGNIYCPLYKSILCDLDIRLVAELLGKYKYFDQVLIKHKHPYIDSSNKKDSLYIRNESRILYDQDKKVFWDRFVTNFHIPEKNLNNVRLLSTYDLYGSHPKKSLKFSILICTLDERSEQFKKLFLKLVNQIEKYNLVSEVEVVFFKDNRNYSIGFKRNALLQAAKGAYIAFVDDDDQIADNYVQLIYKALKSNPDCVSLNGLITFNSKNPRKFIHSLKYKTWFEKNSVYYRCPNHLNPIKSSIAKQFKFPETNFGEDADWSMQICKSGLLKKEVDVKSTYYFYTYRNKNVKTKGRH